jgi:hypothetical protein
VFSFSHAAAFQSQRLLQQLQLCTTAFENARCKTTLLLACIVPMWHTVYHASLNCSSGNISSTIDAENGFVRLAITVLAARFDDA